MNLIDLDYQECRDNIQSLIDSGLENVEDCMMSAAHCDYYLDTHPNCTPEQYDDYRVSKGMISMIRSIKRTGLDKIRKGFNEDWYYLNSAHLNLTR